MIITNMVCREDIAGMQLSNNLISRPVNDGLSICMLALTPRGRVDLPLVVEGNAFEESHEQTRNVRSGDNNDAPTYPSMHVIDSITIKWISSVNKCRLLGSPYVRRA